MKKKQRKRIAFQYPQYSISYWFHEMKDFIERGLYGYAYRDTWSLDYYLSSWLPSALRQFTKGISYPSFKSANTLKKWHRIIQKMIKGFEAHYEMTNGYPDQKRMNQLFKTEKEGLKLFAEWFGHLWD